MRAPVKPYRAVDRYGWVWVSLGNPQHDIPAFAEWDGPSFRKIFCGPYRFHAGAPRVLENFLDVAHFPFVHEGYLGDPDHTEISDYEAVTDENGVPPDAIRGCAPAPDGTGAGKRVAYT